MAYITVNILFFNNTSMYYVHVINYLGPKLGGCKIYII